MENRIKRELARLFKVKDLGPIKYCLGIEIRRNGESIHFGQQGYIKEVLKRFGMGDCKPVNTPIALGVKLTKSTDAVEGNAENRLY